MTRITARRTVWLDKKSIVCAEWMRESMSLANKDRIVRYFQLHPAKSWYLVLHEGRARGREDIPEDAFPRTRNLVQGRVSSGSQSRSTGTVQYSNEQRGRRVKRCHVYLETPKGWHGVSQHRYADQYRSMLLEVFCYCMVVSSQQVTKYGRHLSYLPILLIFCTLPEILTAQHDVLALHWVASWVVYMISLQVRRAACAISHTSISPFS